MYKKLLSFLAAACLVLSLCTPSCADGNDEMTRAEFANGVMDIYEYIAQEFSFHIIDGEPFFNDISKAPYAFRIEQAYVKRFMNGFEDKMFYPASGITRCQAAVTFYRVITRLNEKYTANTEAKETLISDTDAVPDWGKEAVIYMVSAGYMMAEDGNFNPGRYLTRSEFEEVSGRIKKAYVLSDDGERIDFKTFCEKHGISYPVNEPVNEQTGSLFGSNIAADISPDDVVKIDIQWGGSMVSDHMKYDFSTTSKEDISDILSYINKLKLEDDGLHKTANDGSSVLVIIHSDSKDYYKIYSFYPGRFVVGSGKEYAADKNEFEWFLEFISVIKASSDAVSTPGFTEYINGADLQN